MAYKIVVPVSGGKDSQACLKLALTEHEPSEVLGLFCDTQFEHPWTYKHVDWMAQHYGVKIERITAGSVDEKVLKYGRFPGGGARHCTNELKIRPSKLFYKALAENQGGFTVLYGMRLRESGERARRYQDKISTELYAPHDIMSNYPAYLERLGVMFRLPILEWTSYEVMDFLEGKHNPLYDHGFERVGCFPCLAGGDFSKERAFAFDEFGQSQRLRVKVLEEATGKNIFTSRGGRSRNDPKNIDLFSGCEICEI